MTTIETSQATGEDALAALRNGRLGEELGMGPKEIGAGLALAANLLERGAVPDALRLYAGLVLCRPTDLELQAGLANCALKAEQYHLAIQASAVIIATDPRDPRGYLFSGMACLASGELAEAREDLTSAAEMGRAAGRAGIVQEAERLLAVLAQVAASAQRPLAAASA